MVTAQHERGLTRAQRRSARVLVLSVGASVALHVIVLLAFPGIGRRNAPRVEPIEVTLSKPEPPRVVPPVSVAKPPSQKPETKPRRKEEARRAQSAARAGVSPPRPDPPLLVLPQVPLGQTPPPQKPELSVPAPEASPRLEAVPAAPPAKAPAAAPAQSPAAPAPKAVRPDVRDATLLDSSVRYPRTAEKGRVTLKVLVTRDGRAATVNLEKSSGYSTLDQHALQAVKRWRFTPARQGNEPVEQWMTVNVDY